MFDVHRRPLKKGDKVKLLKPDKGYTIGLSNPAVGTVYECVGVCSSGTTVYWENGHQNSYKSLELININNKCVSIWET